MIQLDSEGREVVLLERFRADLEINFLGKWRFHSILSTRCPGAACEQTTM